MEETNIPKASSVRVDWYQTDTHVVVTILAKNAKNVEINYGPKELSAKADLSNDVQYNSKLILSHEISPEQCSYKVFASKIEVKLKKKNGQRWNTLEQVEDATEKIEKVKLSSDIISEKPKYPTSSKQPKDWDKIEKEIEKQDAEEKPEGDAALNSLFQQIYANSSDEVRRAMNKSFQESGGTVLSTNWNEVEKGKVDRKPPDGLEWKNWDN